MCVHKTMIFVYFLSRLPKLVTLIVGMRFQLNYVMYLFIDHSSGKTSPIPQITLIIPRHMGYLELDLDPCLVIVNIKLISDHRAISDTMHTNYKSYRLAPHA